MPEESICAYNGEPVVLPLAKDFYQKWIDESQIVLADYELLDNNIFNDEIYFGYDNSV